MIKLVDVFVMGPFAWRLGHSGVVDAQCPTFSTPFTPRDWKRDTSPTAPFTVEFVMKIFRGQIDGQIPKNLVTNFCGNFLHLKYGQVSTGHGGSKLKKRTFLHLHTLAGFDKPLPLWPLQKKDLRQCCSHSLSLTYSYSVRNAHLSIWFYLYILLGNKSNGLTGCSNI